MELFRNICFSNFISKTAIICLFCISNIVLGLNENCSTINSKVISENLRTPSNTQNGNTYYISSIGNDNNDGLSSTTAWQTISKINSTNFSGGDSILFEGGTSFNGNLYFDSADGNNGASSILISSYGAGRATINANNSFGIFIYNSEGFSIDNLNIIGSGPNTNSNTGIFLFTDLPNDVKLDNFNITNCQVSGFFNGIAMISSVGKTGYSNVMVNNCEVHNCLDFGILSSGFFSTTKIGYSHSNITVSNCEVYDINGYNNPDNHSGSGIVLGGVQNSTIENCTAYNCGSGNTHCGGPVGIWYWDSDSVTIQYCEAYNISSGTGCDGGGFDLDGGVTNGIMQYNYSHDNDGPGYLVGQFDGSRPMQNIIVRYNISENDSKDNGGSLTLFNNANAPMGEIYFYNNTCYIKRLASNSLSSGIHMHQLTPINDNIGFYNNIIYADTDADLVYIPPGYSAEFLGNLYYSNTSTFNIKYGSVIYTSLTAFRNSGNETDNGQNFGIQADPQLNSFGNGVIVGFGNDLSDLDAYKLTESSPAINQGVPLEWDDNLDFFGNNVESDSRDIGANEFQESLSSTGLKDDLSIALYPNPATSILHIESKHSLEKAVLYDILGNKLMVFKNSIDNSKFLNVDIELLSSSIYIIEVHSNNVIAVKKFLKN